MRDSVTTVRQASAEDVERVRAVRLQALADTPEAFDTTLAETHEYRTEDWREWLADGATFLLESSGFLAGIAVCGRHASDASARVLASVWVNPGLRGTSAATRLAAAALGCARSEGAARVVLHVARENLRAQRFYLRQGFCFTGAEVARMRDGLVELEMMLELG